MDHGDDGRGRVRRGDVGFEFPDAAQEFLALDGGIRFIDTGGFGAGKVFGNGWVVGRDGTACKGGASEMREWSSGTRGVTRDVPVTRDEISN